MGLTEDFIELNESSDATAPVAPVGKGRIIKRNGSLQGSVDGGAYAALGSGGGGGGGVTSWASLTGVITTAAAQTALSVQPSNNVNLTGGAIAGPTIALGAGQLSDGIVSVTGSTGVLANPTLSGLTYSGATLSNDLTTGKSGGLTVKGGTAASEGLTFSSTTNATKGSFTFGSSTGMVFNEATNVLSVGIASPTAGAVQHLKKDTNGGWLFAMSNPNAGASASVGIVLADADSVGTAARFTQTLYGTGFTTSGLIQAGGYELKLEGTANAFAPLIIKNLTNQGSIYLYAGASQTSGLIVAGATTPGSIVLGNAALATNATDGFVYVRAGAGAPTGVPNSFTGTVPLYIDSTNHKLYMYIGGWLGGTVPGAFT